MAQILSGSRQLIGAGKQRSMLRNSDKPRKGLSRIRQIIIQTQQLDIPQITILKVQPDFDHHLLKFRYLESLTDKIKLRLLFHSFSLILKAMGFRNFQLPLVKNLCSIIRSKEKNLLFFSMLKLKNRNNKFNFQDIKHRQISRTCLLIFQKTQLGAFQILKSFIPQKSYKNVSPMKMDNLNQNKKLLNKISFYQKIESQLEQADQQIRDSFEKNRKLDQKQLILIIQNQIKKYSKLKDVTLYGSRLFTSAILVKLLKNGPILYFDLVRTLQEILVVSSDNKKLEEIKKNEKIGQKKSALIVQIVNKFIDGNIFGMQPIIEKQYSENEEIIMLEVNCIQQRINHFLQHFHDAIISTQKSSIICLEKKIPEELRSLCLAINSLAELADTSKNQNKHEAQSFLLILNSLMAFKQIYECEEHQKYEELTKQVSGQKPAEVLKILGEIRMIVNTKMEEKNKQIQRFLQNETIMKQQMEMILSGKDRIEVIKTNETIKSKEKVIQDINFEMEMCQKNTINKQKGFSNKMDQLTQKLQQMEVCYKQKQLELQKIANLKLKQQNMHQSFQKKLKTQNECLLRKINILTNKIENLNLELDSKTKRISEFLFQNRISDEGKLSDLQKNSEKRCLEKGVQKSAENSFNLINNLNKQLQKLKISETTLQQINNCFTSYGTKQQFIEGRHQSRKGCKVYIEREKSICEFVTLRKQLQRQFQSLLLKNKCLSEQNKELRTQMRTLQIQNNQIKAKLSKTSMTNNDMILLLTNIVANFIRITEKDQPVHIIQQNIFKELMTIQKNNLSKESSNFIELQQYVINFIANDIGKLKQELIGRIRQVMQLKDRLKHIMEIEISFSKNIPQYQYQYQLKFASVCDPSFSTPIKYQQLQTSTINEV